MVQAVSGPRTEALVARLEAQGAHAGEFKEQVSLTLEPAAIVSAVRAAREEGFEHLSDVMGIDWLTYPGHQGKRFTVVYNLFAIQGSERVLLRAPVDDGEALPTITGVWKGAAFMEREVFDMFGIPFEGHPDLRKLLTPEDLDAHPHRKDFPLGETPTLFKDGRFLDPETFRAGMIGRDPGLTGWSGGARKGVRSDPSWSGRDDEGDGGAA